jgi:hypothetical protein
MKARKVTVKIISNIEIELKKGVDTSEVLSEMDYNFVSQTKGAKIVDTEIVAWYELGRPK